MKIDLARPQPAGCYLFGARVNNSLLLNTFLTLLLQSPVMQICMLSERNMTSFLFRRAKQSDLDEIINLLADDALGKQRENLSEKISSNYQNAFERIDADPNQFLMVAEANGTILGTCHLTLIPSLTFQGGLRMNIEAVRIAASCRGQGVGEWMIQQAISLGQKEGCKIIQLTTNKERVDAKRFYEKLGFTATHEGMKMYLETS